MFLTYRDPAHDGDPIDGLVPVKANELNFVDVTPNGLALGRSPNGEKIVFMDRIVTESERLIKENEKAFPTPEFDLVCAKINKI